VHRPHVRAPAREAASDLQQARSVDCRADLRAGAFDRIALVGEHRARGIGVLDRERTAEAATLIGVGELDQLEVAHVPEQALWSVADPRHAKRVARRVVRNPCRERRPDVVDAELRDEELRQLEDVLQPHELPHVTNAGRRGSDHRLALLEERPKAATESLGVTSIATVQVHLAAARLLGREHDLVTEPLQHLDRRAPGLGKQRVADAGDEQRDPHADQVRS